MSDILFVCVCDNVPDYVQVAYLVYREVHLCVRAWGEMEDTRSSHQPLLLVNTVVTTLIVSYACRLLYLKKGPFVYLINLAFTPDRSYNSPS